MTAKQPGPLTDLLEKAEFYDADEIAWTLEELSPDLPADIRRVITGYLKDLKVEVPKPTFGDTSSIEAAARNAALNQLIEDIEEGVL